jgi:cytochrome c553
VIAIAALLVALTPLGPVGAGPLDDIGAVKAITCTACHGVAGNSKSEAMPILAGMSAAYFKKQIEMYATGKRPSPEMEPYAKQVQALGVDDIAAYFAGQKMEPTPLAARSDAIERGRTVAERCTVCHGKDGKGDPSKLIPSLAGQPAGYLQAQMLLFKQDKRNPGDQALAEMKKVMKEIAEPAFADLAAYYSSLR